MKKIVLIFIVFSSVARAQSTPPPPPSALNLEGRVNPSVYENTQKAKEANQSAGQQAQIIGTGLTMAGSAMAPSCCGPNSTCCPQAIGLIVMGTLAQLQSAKHKGTAGSAGVTGGLTYGYGDGEGDPNGNPNGTAEKYNDGVTYTDLATAAAEKLKKSGVPVTFDSKTNKFNLPGGKKLGPNDFGSIGAMASAGLSKSDIDSIKGTLGNLEKKAAEEIKKSAAFGYEEGGGGGGGGAYGKLGSNHDSGGSAALPNRGISSIDTKGQSAGLSKNYNGEPIGVASDSIFGMMTRRYKLKERQDTFFNGSELSLQK